jgi:hypothetical protein
MALVEIDDSELAAHRRVTDAMQKLLANPKTRRKVLEAQKELNPDVPIPELDSAEPVREELAGLNKRLELMQKAMEDEKAEREKRDRLAAMQSVWDSGRSKLRASGYTDEGLTQVEKFMEDRGIADHEIAAAAFERLHPPAEPVKSISNNRFDLFNPEDRSSEHMKALLANPEDPVALDRIINDTLRQSRGR